MSNGPTVGYDSLDDVREGYNAGTIFVLDVAYVIDEDYYVVVVPDGEGGGSPLPTTFNAETDFSTFIEDNEPNFSIGPYVPAYIGGTGKTSHKSPCDGVLNLDQSAVPSSGDTTNGSNSTRQIVGARATNDPVDTVDQISIGSI